MGAQGDGSDLNLVVDKNAVIGREKLFGVKVGVELEAHVAHEHVLDAVEREHGIVAIFLVTGQDVPTLAEVLEAVGLNNKLARLF